MFICNSTFLIGMEEDLCIERYVHLVSIDHLAHFTIDELLEFAKVHDNVQLLSLIGDFTLDQTFLIHFDLEIGHS